MKKVLHFLNNIPEIIASAAFIVMVCVVAVNVVLRFCFGKSLVWIEEVSALGFIWSIFVGAAACYKRGSLISIDILVSMLPNAAKKTMKMITCAFMIGVNVFLCYLSFKFSLSALTKLSLSLRIPYTCFDMAAAVGFGFMTVYAVRDLIFAVRGIEIARDEEIV